MLVYNKRKMQSSFVRMSISPVPKALLEVEKIEDGIKWLALHPKFYNPGNNFVVIVDLNKQISVCKARFESSSKGDPRAFLNLPRLVPGFSKIEINASAENGLVTL